MKNDILTLIEKYKKTIQFLDDEMSKTEKNDPYIDKLIAEKHHSVIFKIELELVFSRNN